MVWTICKTLIFNENFEFIVGKRVQVNPDNSRAMSALFLLFKLNTLQKKKIAKLWVGRSHSVGWRVLNLHHSYHLNPDIDVKVVVSSQPSVTWDKLADQKIEIRTLYEIE